MSRVRVIIPASKDGKRDRLELLAGSNLLDLALDLSQDERASTCDFSVDDPGGKIGGILLGEAIASGGIIAPKDLLEDPNQNQSGNIPTDGNTSSGGPLGANDGRRVQASELTPRQKAALDTIAYGEGTMNEKGYSTIVGYTYFTDFSAHPGAKNPNLYRQTGQDSDASGRYQFLSYPTWASLGMPDFSPATQDRGTIKYLDRLGATAAINSGDIDQFLRIASRSDGWASMPYSTAGQGVISVAKATEVYENAYKFYSSQPKTGIAAISDFLTTSTSSSPSWAASASAQLTDRLAANDAKPTAPISTTLIGTPIIIEWTWGKTAIAYEFLLTSVDAGFLPSSTQIRGGSIKAQIKYLNGDKRSGSYKNISLAKLAQIVSDRSQLQAPQILGSPASQAKASENIAEISQGGRSDLQLLNVVASKQGFSVREGDGRLIIEPVVSVIIPSSKTPDVALVVDESMLMAGTSFSETASADRVTGSALPDIGSEILPGGNIVKGFPSRLVVAPSAEILKLKPGGVVKLSHARLPKELNRLWRIDRLSLNPFGKSWTISVFLPAKGNPTATSTSQKNGLQPQGATPVYAGKGQKYPLAGVGLVGSEDEVYPGSGLTWAMFTRNGERITNDSMVVNQAIALAKKVAEVARPALGGRSLKVTSWWRSTEINRSVGGASNSRHLAGDAIDVYVEGMTVAQVYAALDPVWVGGLGQYSADGHVHLDARTGSSPRW